MLSDNQVTGSLESLNVHLSKAISTKVEPWFMTLYSGSLKAIHVYSGLETFIFNIDQHLRCVKQSRDQSTHTTMVFKSNTTRMRFLIDRDSGMTELVKYLVDIFNIEVIHRAGFDGTFMDKMLVEWLSKEFSGRVLHLRLFLEATTNTNAKFLLERLSNAKFIRVYHNPQVFLNINLQFNAADVYLHSPQWLTVHHLHILSTQTHALKLVESNMNEGAINQFLKGWYQRSDQMKLRYIYISSKKTLYGVLAGLPCYQESIRKVTTFYMHDECNKTVFGGYSIIRHDGRSATIKEDPRSTILEIFFW